MSGYVSGPAEKVVPVTLADSELPDGPCRSLLVGVAGNANIMDYQGTVRTGVPLQAGYNPIRCKQVRLGTAATGIFALY